MFLLVTDSYPSEAKLYSNMFVHQRVLGYIGEGLPIEVFVCSGDGTTERQYEFEGIHVTVGSPDILRNRIRNFSYQKILVHFLNNPIMEALGQDGSKVPIIVWMHGHEAMSWFRRWFFFNAKGLFAKKESSGQAQTQTAAVRKGLSYYIKKMISQILHLRKLRRFILDNRDRMEFVFVSNWLKKVAETDLRIRFDKVNIIHNSINTEKYLYNPKDAGQRYKLLSIRSFTNRKYANDVTVKAVKLLLKKPYFNQLDIVIAGDGLLFESTVAPLRRFSNVSIQKRFFNQAEMAALYGDYGVFLCPTRMDTQGVSMCEAMSSGMVCISSENSAIPEFLPDSAGYRTKSPRGIVKAMDELIADPVKFSEMSRNAAGFIRGKCDMKDMIRLELERIRA